MLNRLAGFSLLLYFATDSVSAIAAEITPPSIIARQVWQQKNVPAQAPDTAVMVRQVAPLREFIIHHTATRHEQRKTGNINAEMRSIQKLHKGKKQEHRIGLKGKNWGDFAYHYFIDIDGKIAEGRNISFEGDSGTHYDMSGRLLIVLQGHFDFDKPDPRQRRSLDSLVAWLAQKHSIKSDAISDHNDHADTVCPGKYLEAYIPQLKRNVTAALAR